MTITASYRTVGVHQINQWLWSIMENWEYKTGEKAFEAYATGAMADVSPFIPAQQQAEFTNIAGGAPFIVYNYVVNPNSEYYTVKEQGAYIIYDNNIDRLRSIHSLMIDLLRRHDKSAQELNKWLPLNSPWNFKWISVASAVGPDQFQQEGGRQGATISVQCEYTRDQNASGMRF
jgi:hypothetical protein